MCFATAAAIASVAGSAISAYGKVESGQATANAAHYNAEVAANNARYASAAGASQAQIESLRSAQALGRIKSAQAANNVDVNSGSALKVQEGAREAGAYSAENVENNALLKAYGYQQEAVLQNAEAKQAVTGADIGAAGTLLGNASSIGPDLKWMQPAAGA